MTHHHCVVDRATCENHLVQPIKVKYGPLMKKKCLEQLAVFRPAHDCAIHAACQELGATFFIPLHAAYRTSMGSQRGKQQPVVRPQMRSAIVAASGKRCAERIPVQNYHTSIWSLRVWLSIGCACLHNVFIWFLPFAFPSDFRLGPLLDQGKVVH